MDSNLLLAEKLDQIQDLLEAMQKQQINSSTSNQESNNTLIESIQNVMNVSFKKLQDEHEKQLKESREENKKQITEFQNKAESQISNLRNQTTSLITDVKTNCQSYSINAKEDIEKASKNCCESIKDSSIEFHNSLLPDFQNLVEEMKKLKLKNIFNCLVVVVPAMLIVVAITLFGGWFYKSYGNEKAAAELARQVEKREYEEWKANQELELESERTKLENDLAAKKREIESNAVSEYLDSSRFSVLKKSIEDNAVKTYKDSNDFVIDGATYVANNFYQWRILETFYQEMPIKDKKDLKLYDYLNTSHREYREKYGKKTPREF